MSNTETKLQGEIMNIMLSPVTSGNFITFAGRREIVPLYIQNDETLSPAAKQVLTVILHQLGAREICYANIAGLCHSTQRTADEVVNALSQLVALRIVDVRQSFSNEGYAVFTISVHQNTGDELNPEYGCSGIMLPG
jgi:hypothetical protein